jgi:hypothetical protein
MKWMGLSDPRQRTAEPGRSPKTFILVGGFNPTEVIL